MKNLLLIASLEHVQSPCSGLATAAHALVKNELQAVARMEREKGKIAKEKREQMLKKARDQSAFQTPQILESWRLLRDLCGPFADFHSLPLHPFPSLLLRCKAEHGLHTLQQLPLTDLEAAWVERHAGQQAQPKSAVSPVRFQPCLFGACMCSGHPKIMMVRIARFLKQVAAEMLLGGDILIMWQCFELDTDAKSRKDRRLMEVGTGVEMLPALYTHVSLHQLRPWRPTLLQVVPQSNSTQNWMHCVPLPSSEHEHEYQPKIFSIYQWIHSLRPDRAWDVSIWKVSNKHAPVQRVQGGLYVDKCEEPVAKRIWFSDALEVSARRAHPTAAPRRAHEILDPDAEAAAQQGHAWARSLQAVPDDMQPLDLSDSEVLEPTDENMDTLLQMSDEEGTVPREQQHEQEGQGGGEDSSSSSSTSSSTSSSSDSDPDVGREHVQARPVMERPPEHAGTDSLEVAEGQGQQELHRRAHIGSHQWGPFRMTWRRSTPAQRPAWQATCCFHAKVNEYGRVQTRCTRSATVSRDAPESEEAQGILRALKSWLIAGQELDTKELHQNLTNVVQLDDDALEAALLVLRVPDRPYSEPDSRSSKRKRPSDE